jgi:hypothetical protein
MCRALNTARLHGPAEDSAMKMSEARTKPTDTLLEAPPERGFFSLRHIHAARQ